MGAMAAPLVLEECTVLDGTGAAPRAGVTVTVEDGLIVDVGGGRRHPAGARVVDGRGRWLLPGLWDTHVHHVFPGGGFVLPEEFTDEQRHLTWRGCLRSGVTSVVSVGDDKEIILSARAAEVDGTIVAPRVYVSGTIFTAPGGHPCSTILHGLAEQFRDLAVEVDDPADGRARVRRLVTEDEVDLVKVVYSTIPGDVPRLAHGGARRARRGDARARAADRGPCLDARRGGRLPRCGRRRARAHGVRRARRARHGVRRRRRATGAVDADPVPLRQDGARRRAAVRRRLRRPSAR